MGFLFSEMREESSWTETIKELVDLESDNNMLKLENKYGTACYK